MEIRFGYLGVILILCASSAIAADATSDVPFSLERGHIVVQAKIKKDVSVEVVIATGAEHSSFDMALAPKYDLQFAYAGIPPITGHNDRTYVFSVVPDVRLGEVKTSSLSMRPVSLANLSREVGREIFGIIGADFLRG